MVFPLLSSCSLLLACATLAYAGQVTDYAPNTNVECPDHLKVPLVREFTAQTQTLHPQEEAFVSEREKNVLPGVWEEWLGGGSNIGYDLSAFKGNYSKIGMSFAGGGYRASLYGAGTMHGLDARDARAKAAGTGGLLQAASYIAGLSGGSWLVGSMIMNDFPTIPELVYGDGKTLNGWLMEFDLASPDGINLFTEENQAFYGSVLWSVTAKANKGVDTSLTDPWARMISYHFLNQTTRDNIFTNDSSHGAGQLWSQVPASIGWRNRQIPFPIIFANSRPVGEKSTAVLSPESTVYEITPLEFGSWDPALSAMVNITYAGTHLDKGVPPNKTGCVTGFDQTGFMMGTSASLFNQFLDFGNNKLTAFSTGDASSLLYVLARQLRAVRTRANDVANWPSPFQNLKPDTFKDSPKNWIELIDGASNLENIPLSPMFVKARNLDVIVSVDGSADVEATGWPNGTSISFTSARLSSLLKDSHQQFPPIPKTAQEWIDTGTNARPTFFGCYPKQSPPEYPMVISLVNVPPFKGVDPVSNTATFKLSYTQKHQKLFIEQVHEGATGGFLPGSDGPDPNYGKCLQCAAIDRARARLTNPSMARSDICETCFKQYCFDPENLTDGKEQLPNRKLMHVDPDPQGLSRASGFLKKNKGALIGGLVALIMFIGALTGGLIWWKKRKTQQEYEAVKVKDDDAPWLLAGPGAAGPKNSYELPPRT